MEKKITGYTTVDISQWHRKEHFEAFQSVAQCTYNQTVQLDITAFLKTVKKNKHKFYPAFIHILARLMNAHPEFRMAMKDGELVIWDSVHPCYTVFHEQTETFSSLWSEYHDDFRQFLHIYSQDVACYGEPLNGILTTTVTTCIQSADKPLTCMLGWNPASNQSLQRCEI